MNRQEQYFAVYKQSLENLQKPSADVKDEMIVALWESVKNLQRSNVQLAHKIALLEAVEDPDVSKDVVELLARY